MTVALEMERALAELRRRFRERARTRVGELRPLVAALARGGDDDGVRRRARRLAHELAGGAGSFGHPELGRAAAALEALLREPGGSDWGSRLEEAFHAVEAHVPQEAEVADGGG